MRLFQKILLIAVLVTIGVATICAPSVTMAAEVPATEEDIAICEGSYNGALMMADTNQEAEDKFSDIKSNIFYVVNKFIIPALMTLVSIVALIMGILNCVKYFKATEEEARAKAKKNLIGWFIGLVFAFAMIWLLPMFLDLLVELMPSSGVPDNF